MYCKHCGKKIPDDSTFCKYCGKSVEESVDNAASSGTEAVAPDSSTIKGDIQHQVKPNAEYSSDSKESTPKKRHAKGRLRVIMIVIVIAVVALVLATATCGRNKSPVETPAANTVSTSVDDNANTSGESPIAENSSTSAPTANSSLSNDSAASNALDAKAQPGSADMIQNQNESTTRLYDINKVDPTVKAFGDEYEKFVDDYVEFMSKYNGADSTARTSMIGDYNQIMQQYVEVMDKVDKMNDEENTFDKDTYQYWIDLYSRCSQKMLDAAS